MRNKLATWRPSAAMLIALVALVSSLAGGATAAVITSSEIARDAVRGKHVKQRAIRKKHVRPNAIVSRHVKDNTLRARDFRAGELPAGEAGPAGQPGGKGDQGTKGDQGDKGDKGDKGDSGADGVDGAPATRLFAHVMSDGDLSYGVGATAAERTAAGEFQVDFDRDLSNCVGSLTIGHGHPALGGAVIANTIGQITVRATSVDVDTFWFNDVIGSYERVNSSFHLALFCP